MINKLRVKSNILKLSLCLTLWTSSLCLSASTSYNGFKKTPYKSSLVFNASEEFVNLDEDIRESINPVEKPNLQWHGSICTESLITAYSSLLNKQLPEDKINWTRLTADLSAKITWGKKTVDHDAVVGFISTRHRGIFGSPDATRTGNASLKIGDVTGFNHSHAMFKPPMWIKEAWLDISIDAILSDEDALGVNRIKLGYFPYQIGSGVSLGEGYGVSQDFLGELIPAYDFKMPGAMLSINTENNKFGLKFYLARPQAKSATFTQVLGLSKGHLIEVTGIPFGGAFKDDTIFAIQGHLRSDKSINNKFEISPYFVGLNSPDSKIKLYADSSIRLCTLGVCGSIVNDFFEASFDSAMNYGEQKVRSVDTNSIKLESSDYGVLAQTFTGIKNSSTNAPAQATKLLREELQKNLHRDNNPFDVDGVTYVSTPNRITTPYTNKYKGFMGVFDGVFKFGSQSFGLTWAAGLASGDTNPNLVSQDKNYKGFVGINEDYSNKRVPSVIMFGTTIKRPMTLEADKEAVLKNSLTSAFTDIRFVGAGINFYPEFAKEIKGKLSMNGLKFWKDHAGNKLSSVTEDQSTGKTTFVFSSEEASRDLGYEFNCIVGAELLPGLSMSLKGAIFKPGQYYKDIKGVKFDDDTTSMLTSFDLDQVTQNKYSLGTDICYVFGFEIKYSF